MTGEDWQQEILRQIREAERSAPVADAADAAAPAEPADAAPAEPVQPAEPVPNAAPMAADEPRHGRNEPAPPVPRPDPRLTVARPLDGTASPATRPGRDAPRRPGRGSSDAAPPAPGSPAVPTREPDRTGAAAPPDAGPPATRPTAAGDVPPVAPAPGRGTVPGESGGPVPGAADAPAAPAGSPVSPVRPGTDDPRRPGPGTSDTGPGATDTAPPARRTAGTGRPSVSGPYPAVPGPQGASTTGTPGPPSGCSAASAASGVAPESSGAATAAPPARPAAGTARPPLAPRPQNRNAPGPGIAHRPGDSPVGTGAAPAAGTPTGAPAAPAAGSPAASAPRPPAGDGGHDGTVELRSGTASAAWPSAVESTHDGTIQLRSGGAPDSFGGTLELRHRGAVVAGMVGLAQAADPSLTVELRRADLPHPDAPAVAAATAPPPAPGATATPVPPPGPAGTHEPVSPAAPLNSPHLVHRPARTTRPLAEPAPRGIEAPPNLPDGETGSAATAMLPMAGIAGSVLMMTLLRGSQFAVIGVAVLTISLLGGAALFFSQRGRARRTRRTQRRRYLEYLEAQREELDREDAADRDTARLLHPPPDALYDLVADPARLWERRRTDADFLTVRLGSGAVPRRLLRMDRDQSTAVSPPDPFMVNEAAELRRRFARTAGMPLTAPLDRAGHVSVIGPRADTLRVIRALLAQAAVAHAPDDLGIAVAAPPHRLPEWEWAKWLPHTADPEQWDAVAPARRVATDPSALAAILGPLLRARATRASESRRGHATRDAAQRAARLLVVLDTADGPASELPLPDRTVPLAELGLTVLHPVTRRLDEPGQVGVRITVDGDTVTVEDLRDTTAPTVLTGTPDACPLAWSEGLARLLAPLRLSLEPGAAADTDGDRQGFPELLGLTDRNGLAADWSPRGIRDFLRVPIGTDDSGEPVLLDLKESAELGMGPHGLCVGATGSGKSELLRTLVLGLVATHPPQDLAMVLVDYKGGATFAPFGALPHVAGIITNLENKAGLVERVHASLAGEVKRRQQVLKDAGHLPGIAEYAVARATRPDLEPLPHLFVVIDEFGELLTAKPDFIDLFLSIGRIGRSIGVHLLLASQRIESGKLRGLETYLSYRLGLRTFSADESRTVLDSKDAFELPPVPGFGYLKVDTSVYQRFKAAYVSGRHHGPTPPREETATTGDRPLVAPFPALNTAPEPAPGTDPATTAPAPRTAGSGGPTLLSTLVDGISDAAEPVRQIWLPPLPEAVPLDRVAAPAGQLRVPIGVLDDPATQWQGQWILDLTRAGGHAAVVGGPQSGKTTLLRTLMLSLAVTHTPNDVALYGMDLVGGGLRVMDGLPHTGGIAPRTDPERVARTVEELRGMLAEREDLFRAHGIDSLEALRTARAAGRHPQLGSTEIVLVIDGFGALREEFTDVDDKVADLLRRGGGYGIHVVAAMSRWNDVRMNLQSTFGTRVELRHTDPHDSAIDRKLMETVGDDEPGRVLTTDKLFAHTALPRLDGLATADGLPEALTAAVDRVRAERPGEAVRRIRVLPARLTADRLPTPATEPLRVPYGLEETALDPALLDLAARDQHLLVLGDSECGKTNLLTLIAQGLLARHTPQDLVFAVMDPRRGLRTAIPEAYRGGYAHTPDLAQRLATGIAGKLADRLPKEIIDPDAPAPEGFTGPRVVLLVDDYDILATAGQRPLAPLLPLIPSAPDIGLHVILTRRVAGASRAMYEPFVQALKENGATALLMTGDRMEGQLFPGLYPRAQPPGRGTLVRRGEPYRLVQTALHTGHRTTTDATGTTPERRDRP
ncbi:type VII secretion protein EccCa [Streptomyces xiamenensis]|uniref:type VII secretion protein EccCa n=1 Tax=Streptomyces xiamenensis TaxID=408015 RepID=UPI0035D940BC